MKITLIPLRCQWTAVADVRYPSLLSAASAGHGSYRGMSCRIRQLSATAESDPSRSAQWQSLYDADRHAMLARMSRVVGLLFLLETKGCAH